MNHFEAYDSVAFCTFTMLCNHRLCLVLRYFCHPKRKPHTHYAVTLYSFLFSPSQPPVYCVSVTYLLWTFRINGIIQYMGFCDWLLSFSMFLRLRAMLQQISVLHSFSWLYNVPLYRHGTIYLFIYPSVDICIGSTFWLLWVILNLCARIQGPLFSYFG